MSTQDFFGVHLRCPPKMGQTTWTPNQLSGGHPSNFQFVLIWDMFADQWWLRSTIKQVSSVSISKQWATWSILNLLFVFDNVLNTKSRHAGWQVDILLTLKYLNLLYCSFIIVVRLLIFLVAILISFKIIVLVLMCFPFVLSLFVYCSYYCSSCSYSSSISFIYSVYFFIFFFSWSSSFSPIY